MKIDLYACATPNDIATWPWINFFAELGLTLDAQPNLERWHEKIAKRPAVIRGAAVPNLIEVETV
jgi:GST-like protein